MTDAVPRSREALLRLLQDLARADHPTPERLASAREAIRNGHLGPPSEAIVEDGAGRPIPLLVLAAVWDDVEMVKLLLDHGAEIDAGSGAEGTALHAAAASGSLALVELLLTRGASPLASRHTRESVQRAVHRHGHHPIVQLVRRAAYEAIARAGTACAGLATMPFARRYVLRTDRGVDDLRRAVAERQRLDVVLVRSDLKTTARALGNLVQAPRREADVAHRAVQDAHRLVFVYRLRGIDWTIVPFLFEVSSPWNIESTVELAAPGAGISPIARALASATQSRVIHVKYDEHTIYTEHGGIETRRADEGDDELRELGVFVPPMRVSTDGYDVQLQLFGVDGSDVERADLVVLQELGEPEIVRAVQLPTAAPAVVGAPTLLAQGLPPMVQGAPEPGPPRSDAPPMLREPPPIVVETGPAPSEAPPLMREPPALVAQPTSSSSDAPPLAHEPATVAEPSPRKSGPPPLVREPPPLVMNPPTMSEEALASDARSQPPHEPADET